MYQILVEKVVEVWPSRSQITTNTRAVPLVHKDDAHQGRVSFFIGTSLPTEARSR